jgi:hypothetical protein
VEFALVRDAILTNHFARHVRQEIRAVQHLTFRNQVHTAKGGALLVTDTSIQALLVGVEVNADATWCEALGGTNAHHTGVAFDKGHLC